LTFEVAATSLELGHGCRVSLLCFLLESRRASPCFNDDLLGFLAGLHDCLVGRALRQEQSAKRGVLSTLGRLGSGRFRRCGRHRRRR
jgi:hypothetical protein